MDQINDYADDRLIQGCIFCNSGHKETRDHVPSRIFLDPPFPTNLPVVPACFACNNGFSPDEEYVACLIECAIAGTTDPNKIHRSAVAHILRRSPALRSRLEAAKTNIDGRTVFLPEEKRLKNVLLKLARGHVAYELSLPVKQDPILLFCSPLCSMSEEEMDEFDAAFVTDTLGEVGSRHMQRPSVTQVNLKSHSGCFGSA